MTIATRPAGLSTTVAKRVTTASGVTSPFPNRDVSELAKLNYHQLLNLSACRDWRTDCARFAEQCATEEWLKRKCPVTCNECKEGTMEVVPTPGSEFF